MRLHRNQIPRLIDNITEILTEGNQFLEVAVRTEDELAEPQRPGYPPLPPTKIDGLRKDISAVLYNYLKTDQRLHQAARDRVDREGEDHSEVYSHKRTLAKREGFGLGEEAPVYIIDQLIETLMHSNNVVDLYAQDVELRTILLPVLTEAMQMRRNLQQEMGARLRKIEKAGQSWEDLFFSVNQRLRERYQID